MGFNDVLKKLFGNKSDRDMKELMPIVGKVNAEWNKIKNLSNDELREVANGLRAYPGRRNRDCRFKAESGRGKTYH